MNADLGYQYGYEFEERYKSAKISGTPFKFTLSVAEVLPVRTA